MTETLSCPECGNEVESAEELEVDDVPEVEVDEDGTFDLFEKRDLFLCADCRNPMGVRRSKR